MMNADCIFSSLKLRPLPELRDVWDDVAKQWEATPSSDLDDIELVELIGRVLSIQYDMDDGCWVPDGDEVDAQHISFRLYTAWRLFQTGGEIRFCGDRAVFFGVRVGADRAIPLDGLVSVEWREFHPEADDAEQETDDSCDGDDSDERTETCARCAEQVPADDIGAGQLCSWCTQLCR
ncbi:MAG: hypothetical protein FJ361_09735 [Gemmatimonadetes bacterium]|nr:hypothetical protein [Gemmatimonadota bacterium]